MPTIIPKSIVVKSDKTMDWSRLVQKTTEVPITAEAKLLAKPAIFTLMEVET